ncbi:MAG: phage/plasmid primase, P4 family, partial [Halospina sp.]
SPVEYLSDAECPRWERFLREICCGDDELVEFLRLSLGYSLTGLTTEQCFWVLYGRGANGKSVLLNTVRQMFGPLAFDPGFATFEYQKNSSGVPEDVAELAGRRFVTANEVQEKARLNEQRLKVLSHGDPTSARFLYRRRFEFTPTSKIWLALNHRPFVSDDSLGFWRSVRLVPMRAEFLADEAESGLEERLRAELPGILAWAVRACLDWQAAGHLPLPEVVVKATDQYADESDPLGVFIQERCRVDDGLQVGASKMYRAYQSWAEDQGMRRREVLSRTLFGRKLGERFKKAHSVSGWTYSGITVVGG